jgi:hypothetical protein
MMSEISRIPAAGRGEALAFSAVEDSASGEVVLKLTNDSAAAVSAQVTLVGGPALARAGTRTVLAGMPRDQNNARSPQTVLPHTTPFSAGKDFTYVAPGYSVTVFRLPLAK